MVFNIKTGYIIIVLKQELGVKLGPLEIGFLGMLASFSLKAHLAIWSSQYYFSDQSWSCPGGLALR